MSEDTPVYPVDPPNPAAKPGVGGLAAIPGMIGSIIGADDFCSVWNFPLSGVCVADPNDVDRHAIPAWCLYWADGPICNDSVADPSTGTVLKERVCFDSQWKKVNCDFPNDKTCAVYAVTQPGGWVDGKWNDYTAKYVPCNDYFSCVDLNGVAVNCNMGNSVGTIPFKMTDTGICYTTVDGRNGYRLEGSCFPIKIDYVKPTVVDNTTPYGSKYMFDPYMRLIDTNTGFPVTNDNFEGGYPMDAVYPPPPPPPPEPEPEPFDPGKNPFNPTFPKPVEGSETEECSGIICECIALVVNALGAVNNTLLKIDKSVLSVVAAVQNKVIEFPKGDEVEPVEAVPFDDKAILDKLTDILKSIDDISVEVTKEAGTNFWDVLGGAFGDIFDLIEFLIEKVIYLVVPEDTSNINEAFESLNGLISAKMKPVEQVKTAIDGAMNVETKTFEDIYITLPAYGEVKFFETDYIQIALPYVRRILSAMMILMTAFYAYRKVSSEMIR